MMQQPFHAPAPAPEKETLPADLLLLAVITAAVILLPLAGAVLSGHPAGRYLEFPPTTRYVVHAAFSVPIFMGYILFGFGVMTALALLGIRSRGRGALPAPAAGPFPWWGWLGAAGAAIFWVLAWNRFAWFAPLQAHTFFPLWLSYIIVVNALTTRRTGGCMMTRDTGYFLCLFPFSAAFWWLFEYLNRFVQNWYYTGAEYGPLAYFTLASLSFSTVLPAVLSTRDWLMSTHWLSGRFTGVPAWTPRRPKAWAAAGLALAAASLAGIGIWPDLLFPLLWISPLILLISIRQLAGKPHPLTPIAGGEWRPVVAAAAAALLCGVFWEMWNFLSLAKWIYTIPYVQAAHIFEMPLPGWAGYLPFGLECSAVGALLQTHRTGAPAMVCTEEHGRRPD
ncbi:MAG: hypothetical protein ABIL58_04105 [Pseudomonadota bacterium]